MIIANLTNGQSVSFNITVEHEFNKLKQHIKKGRISALALHCNGVRTCLPPPKKIKPKPVYGVEVLKNSKGASIGEVIYTQAGNVRVCLTSTFNSSVIRCDLLKTGLMRFNPHNKVP
jgi:hypothetical protein